MSLESEKQYGEFGKTAAQPYIEEKGIDVPLPLMLRRIEAWVQKAMFAEDKANRVVYQQAFIHTLHIHGRFGEAQGSRRNPPQRR